jgi:hypothetical protein
MPLIVAHAAQCRSLGIPRLIGRDVMTRSKHDQEWENARDASWRHRINGDMQRCTPPAACDTTNVPGRNVRNLIPLV